MTVAIFDKEIKEIIACISLSNGEKAICRKDVDFRIYNGTEPVFTETENGIVLKTNSFVLGGGYGH